MIKQVCFRRVLVALALLLAGCGGVVPGPDRDAVATFAVGTQLTAQGVQRSFDRVDDLDRKASETRAARRYLEGGAINLSAAEALVPEAARQQNATLLAALAAYGAKLSDLADGSEVDDFAGALEGVGNRVNGLVADKFLTGSAGATARTAIDKGLGAARTIAGFVVQRRIARTVATVAKDLHPSIQAIQGLLDQQLEVIDEAAKDRANDLRVNRQEILFELRKDAKVSAVQKVQAFEQVVGDDTAAEVRVALRDSRAALAKMVEAHAALQEPLSANAITQARLFADLAARLAPLFGGL